MYRTYREILLLEPQEFLDFLETKKYAFTGSITCPEEANEAMRFLNALETNYSYVSSLLSHAKIIKREMARNGRNSQYEDMIDKEAAVENALKSIDLTQKALSKNISLYMEQQRELYMTGNIV